MGGELVLMLLRPIALLAPGTRARTASSENRHQEPISYLECLIGLAPRFRWTETETSVTIVRSLVGHKTSPKLVGLG